MAMSDRVETMVKLLEAYGAGVRAGVLTPCLQDENEFRGILGLTKAPSIVEQAWASQGGTRAPVTLQRPKDIQKPTNTEPEREDDELEKENEA